MQLSFSRHDNKNKEEGDATVAVVPVQLWIILTADQLSFSI